MTVIKTKLYSTKKAHAIIFGLIIMNSALFSESSLEFEKIAKTHFSKGDYRSAVHYYRESLLKNPNNTSSQIGAGESYFYLADYVQSEYHFGQALKLDAENEKAMIGLGILYVETGRFSDAKKYLEKVSKINPGSVSNNYAKGLLYLRQRKYDFAELYFDKVLKLNTGHILSLLALSEIELSRGRNDLAESYWNKARQLDSMNPEIHRVRARMDLQYAEKETNPEEKEIYLDRARTSLLSIDTDGITKFDQEKKIIWIDIMKGDSRSAQERVHSLLQNNPDDTELNYLAAYLGYITSEPTEKVAGYFSRILLKNSDDSIARYSYEEYILSHEDKFSPSAEIRKNLSSYHLALYNKFEKEGQMRRSFYHLQRALILYPDSKYLLEKRNEKMIKWGNFEGYLRDLVLLKKKSPDDYKLQHRLEVALLNKKKYISYRERLLSSDDPGGSPTYKRTPTYIYIYDIRPVDPFPTYPDAPVKFADAIIFYLSESGKTDPVPENFRKKVQDSIYYSSKNTMDAGRGAYFETSNISFIEEQENPDLKVNYILDGNYSIKNGTITININLMEKNSTKSIMKFSVRASGKNAIHDLAYNVTRRIENLPAKANVIKVNDHGIFINMGSVDGVKKGDKFRIPEKGIVIVDEVDYYVSKTIPEKSNRLIYTAGEFAYPEK